MSSPAQALAKAAQDLVGTRFRLHGRDPARGLDCIGLVGAAFAAIGRPVAIPAGYRLRQLEIDRWLTAAERAGLTRAEGPMQAGDIVSARPGPAQHHLLIAGTADMFVHAHAGLGRVVATPGPLPWPTERRWRLITE